jgi:hypothetical protein
VSEESKSYERPGNDGLSLKRRERGKMNAIEELESLTGNLETMDAFHDTYVKLLARASVMRDKKTMRAMREILTKQIGFLLQEMIKAKKEELGTEEIVQ